MKISQLNFEKEATASLSKTRLCRASRAAAIKRVDMAMRRLVNKRLGEVEGRLTKLENFWF